MAILTCLVDHFLELPHAFWFIQRRSCGEYDAWSRVLEWLKRWCHTERLGKVLCIMPYERPQNSVEIAIFRVAKEGPLKISRSSGNDAELLFLCSFNSVSESFFVDSQRSAIKIESPNVGLFVFFVWEIYCRNRRCVFWFDRICRVQFFFPRLY